MKELNIYNKRSKTFLGKVNMADNFSSRLIGLLGSTNLCHFKGLLIKPCRQVHTIGMRYSISIWYINRDLKVIKIIDDLQPYRISPYIKESHFVIEFPKTWGSITDTRESDNLEVFI